MFLDTAQLLIEGGRVAEGMEQVVQYLRKMHLKFPAEDWKAFIASEVLTHPIRSLIHEDPITHHSFSKPRGYPGDAALIDYIYGCGQSSLSFDQHQANKITNYTRNSPAGKAVRYRRSLVAQTIDRLAHFHSHRVRILSIAAGHLREAEISHAVREGRVGEYVALDQDKESLKTIAEDYSRFGVTPLEGSVRGILAGKHRFEDFDFVYASGLFDYLSQPVGQKLVEHMFAAVRPGGEMLIANFIPGISSIRHVSQQSRLCAEAGFDVAQALPVGQLGEDHTRKLVETSEGAHVEVAAILGHQPAKRMPRDKLHQLGEHKLADMHSRLPDKSGKPAVIGAWCSNRLHPKTSQKSCQFRLLLAGTGESVGHY